ncbi:methionine--tRNA ligase [Anaerosporobacter faecicola]|uniref:methionine--tRNA ligase n=1 Tax=Anaerosporobacter faecicola TaxID=2718714 RepID=UPI00143AEC80|nr:class I tRNA ligase family protein [Anaerosporobacter faecicola]
MFSKKIMPGERPCFPKKAVITAGMPYGNKKLHFGHVGGMFVHADIFARFLRDRIGKDNVIFVSGTDCYGSPILESYRKLKEAGYEGTIEEYVQQNHESQKETLKQYEISPNLFGASALGRTGEIHQEVSSTVFKKLYDHGYIKQYSTPQFYDEELGVYLNGRQVVGKCPIAGCTSEHAYADECSLGHQYMPNELINPISVLSGKKPAFRDVTNWYFVLEDCIDELKEQVVFLKKNTNTRKYELNIIEEFLKKPLVHVPKKYIEDLPSLESKLPAHETTDEEKKKSVTFAFDSLELRDEAKKVLEEMGIHYTAGKTLVPFRLSGNVEWGVKVPDMEEVTDLTFWVWPESLWAPISFTQAYLESIGHDRAEWKDWWNGDDSLVYQFIGEDNIYFYAIAEMGLFGGLRDEQCDMKYPHIIANRHILFMDTKASSSSEIKPPMADELLEFYTPEQLRMHFMSLGLSSKSTGFKPQVYMKEEERVGVDMVLKDGNLLTNVFNRLIRSCFYTTQSYYDGIIPTGEVSEKIQDLVKEKVLEYERQMYNHEFHRISYVLDEYIREINKYWVNQIRVADQENNDEIRKQVLVDCFYACKVMAILVHPIAPTGCELFREYLNVGEELWNWEYIFEPLAYYTGDLSKHTMKFLEPRVDFFAKLESQFK